MPELYKRTGSPYWQCYLRNPDALDGIERRSTKQRNKADARRVAESLQAELDQERAACLAGGDAGGLLWSDASAAFIAGSSLKPSTAYGYVSLANIIRTSCLGDFALNALGHDHLRDFVRERRLSAVKAHNSEKATDRTVSDAAIRRALSLMSSVYQFLMDREYEGAPKSNPLRTFDRRFLKESQSVDRHLRVNQFELVMRSLTDPIDKLIVLVLVGTGMRTSELLELRWGEVDLNKCHIEFGNLDVLRTKTSRYRKIPLNPLLVEALGAHRAAQRAECVPSSDETYVFPSGVHGGRRYSLSYLRKTIQRRTGLEGFTIHGLRHTYASWLLQKSIDPIAIRDVLGHTTLYTTNRYAHHLKDTAAEQVRTASLPISAQFTAQSIGFKKPGDA